jgi:hypothetical protein
VLWRAQIISPRRSLKSVVEEQLVLPARGQPLHVLLALRLYLRQNPNQLSVRLGRLSIPYTTNSNPHTLSPRRTLGV